MAKTRPKPTLLERIAAQLIRAQFTIYTSLVLVLIVATFLWPRIFIVIPPGSRGVRFRFFGEGTVTDKTWPEGLHIIPPWDKLTLYVVRRQHQNLRFAVLSVEGLDLTVRVAVRFQPNIAILGYLHQDIGPRNDPGELDGFPYVEVQELKLTGIELPAVVEVAIAEKYRQEQLMLEYEYKLEREEREAERSDVT